MANPVEMAILQKMVEGVIVDLMIRTNASNIVVSNYKGGDAYLSTVIADLVTKDNTLGTIATLNSVDFVNLASALQTLINGKANTADIYTKSQIDSLLSGAFSFKGSKDYQNLLPSTGNVNGDVWEVKYTGTSGTKPFNAEFAWNGTAWIEMGSFVDLSGYVPNSLTINGKALTSNVTLTPADIGAAPNTAATPSVPGLMSAADKTKLDAIAAGANNYSHPNSGVGAGTYRSVTVNAQGHVTAGTNPTLGLAEGGTGAVDAANARLNIGASQIQYGTVTPANLGANDLFIQIVNL